MIKMVNGKWLMFNVGRKIPSTIIHLTLYIGALLSSCQTDIQTINLITSGKDIPIESVKDAEIMYSDSGKVKMKLAATQLDHYAGAKPYVEFPKGIHLFFYNDSLKMNSELKANYGIRYENDDKMEVKRSVEAINIKGEKLNTEHLIWDQAKQIIYTEAFVKITTKDEVIYGDGLESNQNFTKYKIRNIKGTINLNK